MRNRFKTLFAFIGAMLSMLTALAQEVDESTAQQRALSFLQKSSSSMSRSMNGQASALSIKLVHTSKGDMGNNYYAYNVGYNEGFIVVSADDRAEEVLCYADEGTFNINNMAPSMKWWMGEYEKQLKQIRQTNTPTSSVNSRAGAYYAAWSPVKPLLTSAWDQGDPYNLYTPMVNPSMHAPTGCVATAMAQIMHANKYPEHGYGSHSYTMRSFMTGKDTTLTANFSQHVYDWDKMEYDYTYSYHGDAKAVARLMSDCGIAVDMHYGFGESGSYSELVAPAMINYFGYDDHTVELKRDNFDSEHWAKIIYESLSKGLPIFYSGYDLLLDEGHAFVCDGYESDNYFHFDFGWAGQYNGFFKLSAIKANIDGNDAGFNHYQSIVLAYPHSPVDNYPFAIVCNSFSINEDGTIDRTGTLTCNISLSEPYNKSLSVLSGVQLSSSDGQKIYVWSQDSRTTGMQSDYFGSFEIPLKDFPTKGTYELEPAFKLEDGTIITLQNQADFLPFDKYQLSCNSNTCFIGVEQNNDKASLEVVSLEATQTAHIQHGAIVKAVVRNTGNIDYYDNIFIRFNNSDGVECVFAWQVFLVKAGETKTIEYRMKGIHNILGKYEMWLSDVYNNTLENSKFDLTILDEGISYPYEQEGFKFQLLGEDGAEVIGLNREVSPNEDLLIPEFVNVIGKSIPVTSIGANAFYCVTAKSIDIPSSVIEIGRCAFWQCYANFKVHWQVPIVIEDDKYYFDPYVCRTYNSLDVPQGTSDAYSRAVGWHTFGSITENGDQTIRNLELSVTLEHGGGSVYVNNNPVANPVSTFYGFHSGDIASIKFCPRYTNSVIGFHTDQKKYVKNVIDNAIDIEIVDNMTFMAFFGEKVGDVYYMAISPSTAVVVDPSLNGPYDYDFYPHDVVEVLDRVTIGGKEYDVVNFAFLTQFNSDTIKVNWTDPFVLNEEAFSTDFYGRCVLDVPVGTADKYARTAGWSKFSTITERGIVKSKKVSLSFTDYYNSLPNFYHLYVNGQVLESGENCMVDYDSDVEIFIKRDNKYSLYKVYDQGESWDSMQLNGTFSQETLRKDSLRFDESKWSLEYLLVNGVDINLDNGDEMKVVLHNITQNAEITPKVVYKDNGVCYHPRITNIAYLTVYDEENKFSRVDTIYGMPDLLVTWGRYSGDVIIPAEVSLGNNKLTITTIDNYCFSPKWPNAFMYDENIDNHYSMPTALNLASSVTNFFALPVYLPQLRYLIVHWNEPIDITRDVFYIENTVWSDNSMFENATLMVPVGTLDKYKNHPTWGLFKRIVEGDDWRAYERTFPLGDTNFDEMVSVTDYVSVACQIVDVDKPKKFNVTQADVNRDGDINVTDYVQVANIILYDNPQGSVFGARVADTSFDWSNTELCLGGANVSNLVLSVKNTGAFTAFQFDVELPHGISVDSVEKAFVSNGHKVTWALQGDSTYRFLCGSMENINIPGNELIHLGLNIVDDFEDGNISISNIKLVEANGSTHNIKSTKVNINPSATGLNTIESMTSKDSSIFDIQGRKLNSVRDMPAGVYINKGQSFLVK